MQVKPVLRTLRKKANKAAKEALSLPSAYGELMTVTRPGAKPSSHARKLLEGEARIPGRALVDNPPCAAAQDAIQLTCIRLAQPPPSYTACQPSCRAFACKVQGNSLQSQGGEADAGREHSNISVWLSLLCIARTCR